MTAWNGKPLDQFTRVELIDALDWFIRRQKEHRAKAFRRYYRKHRIRLLQKFSERRRQRYAEDAEFRMKAIESTRQYRAKNKTSIKVRRETARYLKLVKASPSLHVRHTEFLKALASEQRGQCHQ